MNEAHILWGWEPALYLFLGGLGAGTFAVAAVVYLISGAKRKKMMAVASWASVACIGIGLLLLVVELEAPLRGLMMWQSFSHFTSWMTFGAWVALGGLVTMGLTALFTTEFVCNLISKKWKSLPDRRDRIVKVLSVIGLVLGLGIAVYTGLLLMTAPGVPLWNTWLLPCLFTVSALDTGVALVVWILFVTRQGSERTSKNLERAVLVLVLAEIIVLAAFVTAMLAGNPAGVQFAALATEAEATVQMQVGAAVFMQTAVESIQRLLSGDLALWFWIVFVGLGLVVPLFAAALGILPGIRHEKVVPIVLVGGACALVGGCALRFLMLYAGAHADIVKAAVSAVLG